MSCKTGSCSIAQAELMRLIRVTLGASRCHGLWYLSCHDIKIGAGLGWNLEQASNFQHHQRIALML